MAFAVFIFGMRHPVELRGLLDGLEAVFRAQDGAEDGSVDPEEGKSNEEKFEAIKKGIEAGDKGKCGATRTRIPCSVSHC